MTTSQSSTFEKNIYVEKRSGAYRFIVKVYPLSDTGTFSSIDEGAPWARRRRVELLEQKAANKRNGVTATSAVEIPKQISSTIMPPIAPESISMAAIFDSYEKFDLPNLSGREAEASRIRNLRVWFGDYSIGQLDSKAVIEEWKLKRESGLLGSGRNPYRGDALRKAEVGTPLTKQQRHSLKKKGLLKSEAVFPVSTQTVRHDLAVLRRAIKAYFNRTPSLKAQKRWLNEHEAFTMEMPDAAEARDQRLSDKQIMDIVDELPTVELKSAVMFALLTTLRRTEILSLRWEDVDFTNSVARLRAPGHHHKKSKITARNVPLLPGAVQILNDLGRKEEGTIFNLLPNTLSQAWRKAADAANAYNIRLHDCRRESITRLAEKGKLTTTEIVVFSGHSNVAVLEKHYLKIDPSVIAGQVKDNPRMKDFMPSI